MNHSFVYKCVATLFADMINESNVGNGFRWYNFPKMASQYVVNQMKLSGEYTTLARQEAELTALEFAKELIDRSGIHD